MGRLGLYRGEHPEGAVEASVVVPVDPAGGRELDVREGPVGAVVEDGIERIADGPDRGSDALEVEVRVLEDACQPTIR